MLCYCNSLLVFCFVFIFSVPDFNFSGRLSSVYASLDYSQYCFILGMLGENFGEPLEEFERPSSVIQDPLGKVTRTPLSRFFSFSLLTPLKVGTHEGACSRSTLLQHAPGAKLPSLHQRFLAKKYVAQQNICSRVLLPRIKLI